MAPLLSNIRATALVAELDLSLAGVCLACLSFVSFAVEDGDEREIGRQVRAMTPDLWEDGLDVQALAAVRAACGRGVRDGPEALAELVSHGPRSGVARAIVRRLAEELARQTGAEVRLERMVRSCPGLAPPELN